VFEGVLHGVYLFGPFAAVDHSVGFLCGSYEFLFVTETNDATIPEIVFFSNCLERLSLV